MSPLTLALSQRILARLMPPAQAEALLGDLLEERRLRLQAGSQASVAGWCWRQLASSVPVLLWASVRRGAWLITVVTAVGSCIAAVGIQMRAPVAVSDDDVEVYAGGHHSSLLRRRTGRLRVRRRVNPSRGGATARLPRVCHDMRDAGDQHARPALVRGVASRPRSASHNRRRDSLRVATSYPALAGLLRHSLYARARTPRDPDRRRRPSRSIPVQFAPEHPITPAISKWLNR